MWLTLTLFSVICLLVSVLVRSKIRADEARRKTPVNPDFHVIEANTFETGHSSTYFVTKDPQKYAKIFVPKSTGVKK